MAIVLLGILVLPLMDAVITLIRASSVGQSAAKAETTLVNAADRLNRAEKDCDYLGYSRGAVQTQGWSEDRITLVQQYYVPGSNPMLPGTWLTGNAATPACRLDEPSDGEVQRVTISVTTPDGDVTRTIQVVKSDV